RRLLGKTRYLLCHSQGFQRWSIDCGRCVKSAIALVSCDRPTRNRPEQTIDFALIITLLLQCGLHVGGHLIRWQTIIAVNRAVICIIRVGIVAPSRDPVSRIPSIPSAVYE